MTTIGFAIVYIVALLVGIFVRRVRYQSFSAAAGAGTGALAVTLIDAQWLSAAIWVFNLALVAVNWHRWRRADAARDELERLRSQW